MNLSLKQRPIIKLLAIFMALMVLFVQFTEAFHHHAAPSVQHHQSDGMISKVQFKADCAICHFLSHQQSPEDPQSHIMTFVLAAIVFSLLVQLLISIHIGHRHEITGRGPPASSTLFI